MQKSPYAPKSTLMLDCKTTRATIINKAPVAKNTSITIPADLYLALRAAGAVTQCTPTISVQDLQPTSTPKFKKTNR